MTINTIWTTELADTLFLIIVSDKFSSLYEQEYPRFVLSVAHDAEDQM